LHWHSETWFPVRQKGSELVGVKGGKKKLFKDNNNLKGEIKRKKKEKRKRKKREPS
jgi:hypothetical protein